MKDIDFNKMTDEEALKRCEEISNELGSTTILGIYVVSERLKNYIRSSWRFRARKDSKSLRALNVLIGQIIMRIQYLEEQEKAWMKR